MFERLLRRISFESAISVRFEIRKLEVLTSHGMGRERRWKMDVCVFAVRPERTA
jgi:hypothetical protein